jgi:hypothetical protein
MKISQKTLKAIADYRRPDTRKQSNGSYLLTEKEECSCCRKIRQPSRNWPFSLSKHAETVKHLKCYLEEKPKEQIESEIIIPYIGYRLRQDFKIFQTFDIVHTMRKHFDFEKNEFTKEGKNQFILFIADKQI